MLIALVRRLTRPAGQLFVCLLVFSSLSAVTRPSAAGTAPPANFADLIRDPAPGNAGVVELPGLSATEQANAFEQANASASKASPLTRRRWPRR